MIFIIAIVLLAAAVYAPQWWMRHIFAKYSAPRDDLAGTGGELAQHLIEKFNLSDVTLEPCDQGSGDHYDPSTKTVRLSPEFLAGKSLSAVAVAAHEVGHAIQHQQNYSPLLMRSKLVVFAHACERLGAATMFIAPVLMLLSKSPAISLIFALAGILSMGMATVVHLITLPVEFDASFNRALPILLEGKYVSEEDMIAVRKILLAAALTYVAASLASLFNIWRWIRFLRR